MVTISVNAHQGGKWHRHTNHWCIKIILMKLKERVGGERDSWSFISSVSEIRPAVEIQSRDEL